MFPISRRRPRNRVLGRVRSVDWNRRGRLRGAKLGGAIVISVDIEARKRALAPRLIGLFESYCCEGAPGASARPPACELPAGVSAERLLGLVSEVLGADFSFFRAGEMLIWEVARHEGYTIPAYPMAGCGDVREFLAGYGARDVPSWYEARGVSREIVADFYAWSCILVRSRDLWRKILLLPTADVETPATLMPHLLRALRFCEGNAEGTGDPTLFRL